MRAFTLSFEIFVSRAICTYGRSALSAIKDRIIVSFASNFSMPYKTLIFYINLSFFLIFKEKVIIK